LEACFIVRDHSGQGSDVDRAIESAMVGLIHDREPAA